MSLLPFALLCFKPPVSMIMQYLFETDISEGEGLATSFLAQMFLKLHVLVLNTNELDSLKVLLLLALNTSDSICLSW